MLSPVSRYAAIAVGLLYAVLGAIMFAAPVWASANFAWNVSPFVAMTIGGWCLGNAWAAFGVARRWHLALVASALVYLALFGLFETAVAIAFSDRLKLGHWLGWLYVAALAVNVAAALLWLGEWLARRPAATRAGASIGPAGMFWGVVFVALVGFIGLYGLLAPAGARGLGGGIFPEVISMFTLRAFGAFFSAIALAPLVLLFRRDFEMTLSHAALSWGLLAFIMLAAAIGNQVFDILFRPGQLLYLGAYLVVALVTGIYILRYGRGRLN